MNKEQIHDNQINPLMAQILEICQAHKIAMVASFSIPTEDDPELMCTSALTADEYEPPRCLLQALRSVLSPEPVIAFTTTEGG